VRPYLVSLSKTVAKLEKITLILLVSEKCIVIFINKTLVYRNNYTTIPALNQNFSLKLD